MPSGCAGTPVGLDLQLKLACICICCQPPVMRSHSTCHALLRCAAANCCHAQNAAVDAANKALFSSSKEAAVQVAWLRQMSCELLHAVPAGQLQEYQLLQLVTFCLKVRSSHDQNEPEMTL